MAEPTKGSGRANLISPPEEIFRPIIQELINPRNAGLIIGARRSRRPQSFIVLNLETVLVIARVNWKLRTTLYALISGLDRKNYFLRVNSLTPILRFAQHPIGEYFFRTVNELSVDASAVRLFQDRSHQSTTEVLLGCEIFSGLSLLSINLSHTEEEFSPIPKSLESIRFFVKTAMSRMLEKHQGHQNLRERLMLGTADLKTHLELTYWQQDTMVFGATIRGQDMNISSDSYGLGVEWVVAYRVFLRRGIWARPCKPFEPR